MEKISNFFVKKNCRNSPPLPSQLWGEGRWYFIGAGQSHRLVPFARCKFSSISTESWHQPVLLARATAGSWSWHHSVLMPAQWAPGRATTQCLCHQGHFVLGRRTTQCLCFTIGIGSCHEPVPNALEGSGQVLVVVFSEFYRQHSFRFHTFKTITLWF